MKKKLGLTLIELLAVIAIIAILFILLVPQITKAIDKSRVSGVQVDLHSYEVGMRAYFMENFGEKKTVENLNKYLDKSLQFEEIDNKWVSKVEENPYKVKYELNSDWQTYMQVNSYTDEKDPRLHGVRVYEEGNEVKSIYIGFDEDKRKSEVDTNGPIIIADPNGGTDIDKIFVDVTDDTEVFKIQYMWSTEKNLTQEQWQSISNNTELSTIFLGRGEYYLHIKATDIDMNVTKFSSEKYILGDTQPPIVTITINGSDEEKTKHTTVVSAIDNKGVAKMEYAWSNSNVENQVTTDWKTFTNASPISTPAITGGLYLHIKVTDISGNVTYFISKPFKTGDSEAPIITVSQDGNSTAKNEHETKVTVTDNVEVRKIEYIWTTTTTRPSNGWSAITNNQTLKSPKKVGDNYLHVKATDNSGNVSFFVSKTFKVKDDVAPVVKLTPNGNSTAQASHSTTINATDDFGVKEIYYQWTNSTAKITPKSKVENDTIITKEFGRTGSYYLHIKAIDENNNEAYFISNEFKASVPIYCPANPNSTTDFTTSKITSSVDGTEGVRIDSYKGTNLDVAIPCYVDGKPVLSISNSVFNKKNLTSIDLPGTLEVIGAAAFQYNKLEEVKIPASVITLGNISFAYNNIKSVKITESIKSFGGNIFFNNSDLKTVQNCNKKNNEEVIKLFNSAPTITNDGC